MGLPAQVRREQEEWEQKQHSVRQARRQELAKKDLPRQLKAAEVERKKDVTEAERCYLLFQPFKTAFTIDGKLSEIEIRPSFDNPRHEGYPTLYDVNVDRHFYAWLVFKDGNWQWWEKGSPGAKPDHIAEEIGWKIIAGRFQ